MYPPEIRAHFEAIDRLIEQMERFVPEGTKGASEFRADLAGMLVVSIAATYENCVKTTIVTHASKFGKEFESFAERQFNKLSSKVAYSDLKRYAATFDPKICSNFEKMMERRRSVSVKLCGKNPISRLDTLLGWRHDYAHARLRQTSITEATNTHRVASIVFSSFHRAFNERSP